MVTRYTAIGVSANDVGEYVYYSDYFNLLERVATLEAAIQSVSAVAAQAVPPAAKTADEQAVTDFVLTLVRKGK